MDELIKQLEQLTDNMMDRLYQTTSEELEAFVEARQELVNKIGDLVVFCQLTNAQKQAIGRIMERDSEILARMNALRLEAQDWLQKRNQSKVQRSAYEAAYTPDSFLMDRRK